MEGVEENSLWELPFRKLEMVVGGGREREEKKK
jgi:hypothetical protein